MRKKISKLHFISTSAEQAEQACKGGADWIQLRLKNISYEDYRAEALNTQAVCKKYGATFIVNDNVYLALEIDADGVHVGKGDPLPQDCIEKMLAKDGIIGVTVNDLDDFEHLHGKDVGYIGFGPFRFTTTKQKLSPVVGMEGYRKMFEELNKRGMKTPPVVGIGGITLTDVPELLTTGLHGVAVSGAIANAADVAEATKQFRSLIYQ